MPAWSWCTRVWGAAGCSGRVLRGAGGSWSAGHGNCRLETLGIAYSQVALARLHCVSAWRPKPLVVSWCVFMPSPKFRFLFALLYLVHSLATAQHQPASPLPATAKGGEQRQGTWLVVMTLHGVWVPLLKVTSPFLSLWALGFFFPCLCVRSCQLLLSREFSLLFYPLLHQPRVPSLFLLDHILLMRRDFGAAAFLSKQFLYIYPCCRSLMSWLIFYVE